MVNTFVMVYSSNNLSEEVRRYREKIKSENIEALQRKVHI